MTPQYKTELLANPFGGERIKIEEIVAAQHDYIVDYKNREFEDIGHIAIGYETEDIKERQPRSWEVADFVAQNITKERKRFYQPKDFILGFVLGRMICRTAFLEPHSDKFLPGDFALVDVSAARLSAIRSLESDEDVEDWLLNLNKLNRPYAEGLRNFITYKASPCSNLKERQGLTTGGVFAYGIYMYEHLSRQHEIESAWGEHAPDMARVKARTFLESKRRVEEYFDPYASLSM